MKKDNLRQGVGVVPAFRIILLSFALASVFWRPASAQTATPPTDVVKTTTASSDDNKEIELSPFQVRANNSLGYVTNETLAGSRIRTPLVDSPSAISMLTPEYMQDVGAKSLYEVLDYIPSVMQDESSVRFFNSRFAMAVRIRGIKAQNSVTQDFFNIYWAPDVYNTSDMGVARGANSILFGVGNPAGVFTATSKTALFGSNFAELGLRFDTYNSKRGEVDINQEIVPDKLAVRVALLDQNQQYFYKPTYNKLKAQYVTLTGKIIDQKGFKTTVSGNYEHRNADRVFGQQWTPDDAFTMWIRAGRPLIAGARPALNQTAATLLPLGLALDGTSGVVGRTMVNISPSGISSAYYQQNNILTQRNDLAPPQLVKGGLQSGDRTFKNEYDSPVPFDVNLSGPGANNPYHAYRYVVMLDQQIGKNFFAQLAYTKNDFDLKWGDPGVGLQILADVNLNLPDGSLNPNAGKLYTNSGQRPEWNHWSYKELRFTSTYHLDLVERRRNRWLGRHQLSVLANRTKEYFWHNVFTEQNTTPLPGASADIADASNSITRRTYIDNNSRFLSGPSMLEPLFGGGIKSAFIARALPDSSLADLVSTVETVQSKFWDDRIVLTYGIRQDHLKRYLGDTTGVARDPVTRDFVRAEALPFSKTPLLDRKLHSTSKGIVFHVTKWAALTYNESENFNPTATTQDIYGKNLPPEGGEAKDYGIRFTLPNSRLYATINRFENSDVSINSFNANRPTDAPALRGLLILAEGSANSITTSNSIGDTTDLAAEGTEIEVTANLAPNWRLSLSFTRETAVTSNVIPITSAWWAAHVAKFKALDPNLPLPASVGLNSTVGQAISGANQGFEVVNILPLLAQEGRAPNAFRQNNFSAVTNYEFRSGPLKYFSIGGKVRYYGEAVWPPPGNGYYLTGVTDRPYEIFGLNFGYRRILFKDLGNSRGVDMTLRVIIDNVTDFKGVIRSESANIWRQLPDRSAAFNATFRY